MRFEVPVVLFVEAESAIEAAQLRDEMLSDLMVELRTDKNGIEAPYILDWRSTYPPYSQVRNDS